MRINGRRRLMMANSSIIYPVSYYKKNIDMYGRWDNYPNVCCDSIIPNGRYLFCVKSEKSIYPYNVVVCLLDKNRNVLKRGIALSSGSTGNLLDLKFKVDYSAYPTAYYITLLFWDRPSIDSIKIRNIYINVL